MKRFLKPVMALVAAFGLLTLLAAPSAASSGTVTGGTLTVNLTPVLTTDLGAGGCGATVITALDSSTGTTGSTTVTGTITISISGGFTYTGTNYVFAITGTGTYTAVHGTGTNYTITVHVNLSGGTIREANATNPCLSTGTVKCSAIASTSFTLTGTASLTAVHPGPLGTVHLAGSRTVTGFGCTAPFSTLSGKTATISSMTTVLA